MNKIIKTVPEPNTSTYFQEVEKKLIETLTSSPLPCPAPTKLPEGWHFTAKYEEVFISHGGIAYTVQLINYQLKSIPVRTSSSDIIQTKAIDKVKQAQRIRQYRKSKVSTTSSPIYTPQVLTDD